MNDHQLSPMSATNDRETPALDPAQQSLADALRVSFTILKFVMIAVLIAYGASGIFSVGSNEVALRLRFGDYVGAPGERVLERGTYFAAPFPIEQVIKIDTRPVSLNLAEAFWYEAGVNDRGRTRDQIRNSRAGPLDPVRDGSLLTGDMNIVHTRWTVTFQITEPVAYITNVGETDLAEEIVRCAVSQAIVQTVAQLPADEILKGVVNRETATLTAQRQLDEMAAGLTIAQLALDQVTAPNSVMGSFDAVTTAETERSRQIVESQQDRARILGETAGEASGNLLALLDRYERARETTAADADAVAEAINRVFDELRIDNVAIGGEVAEVMNAARTYRTQVVERLKGDRDIFERLLPQFLRNPRIILTRLWEDAKERILTGDVETFYTLPGKLELQLNRDPEIQQARQRQQLQGLKERQAEFDR